MVGAEVVITVKENNLHTYVTEDIFPLLVENMQTKPQKVTYLPQICSFIPNRF